MNKEDRDRATTELKIALDNRAFEIQLFWQRSNYFLVLMTALGVATFSVKDSLFSPLVASFATMASYFWLRTNLGSKFWQESWEIEVTELAKEQNIRSFEKTTSDVVQQVKTSLLAPNRDSGKSVMRSMIDYLTCKKYSVTYNMILLSLFATVIWSIVALIFWVRLLNDYLAPFHRCVFCIPS